MTSIGETLRGERLRRNLDIQGISRELKIPAKFLEAIEKEQFDKLPASVFARSFVRQYARYLGLHEDDIVDTLQRLLEPPATVAETAGGRLTTSPEIQVDRMAEWESVGERRSWSSSLPALALVVVVMLGCSGVYAWWQRNRHAVSAREQTPIAGATGQAQDSSPAPVRPPQTVAAAPRPPAPTPGAADTGVSQEVSTAQSTGPAAAVPPAPAAANSPGATPGAAPAARTPGPVHVEITASSLVWLSAKADGKTSFIGTLEASQSRTIDGQDMVEVRLGNAAGAEIKLNGKPIGTVGPSGQPRTVQLTSGGFQIVAPKPPDLDPLR